MQSRLFLALACVLVLVRMPSLVQPMGADQGLYSYVGERILDGGLPYRDAWDQKPPAIHFVYAALRAVWASDAVVAAADLAAAVGIAWMLVTLGSAVATAPVGWVAALLFLFLGDPNFQRLGGVASRSQCETFIALVITGAFLLTCGREATGRRVAAAGVLIGVSAALKYNAAVYGAGIMVALWLLGRLSRRTALLLLAGAAVVPSILLLLFVLGGAFTDLYYATIEYNLQYSGETYSGPLAFLSYLLTFPVQHARIDALWLLGGAGCAVLLVVGLGRRERWVPVVWVAAACLTIAINSSRGLPQYFVQALPGLALAAAWGGAVLWRRRSMVKVAALLLAAVAVWRVNDFGNLWQSLTHDVAYVTGRISQEQHLERFGDREARKYSALAMAELAAFMREHSRPEDRIYVFGFSSAAYVQAERISASRFFWSRPVIVDFKAGEPGYGVDGLRADLEAARPLLVALQVRDWWPDVSNSAEFFLSTPALAEWLARDYERVEGPAGYDIWRRRSVGP